MLQYLIMYSLRIIRLLIIALIITFLGACIWFWTVYHSQYMNDITPNFYEEF